MEAVPKFKKAGVLYEKAAGIKTVSKGHAARRWWGESPTDCATYRPYHLLFSHQLGSRTPGTSRLESTIMPRARGNE